MSGPFQSKLRSSPSSGDPARPPDGQARLEQSWRSRLLADPSDAAFRDAYDALHAAMRDRPGRASLYEASPTRLDRAFLSVLDSACRVLDIGAGNGRFSLAAASTRWVVAVEISADALAAIHASTEARHGLALCQASGIRLPFRAGSFDAVVSQDLVEHLHPDHLATHLAEVHRVLVPGGRYLLHTPSALHGQTSLGLHLHEYRLRELRRLTETVGFQARWICLSFARLGCARTAPTWLWPALEVWEAFWNAAGRLGARRLGGRWFVAGIPDVDLNLVKPE